MMRQPWLLAEGSSAPTKVAWRFDIALVNRFVACIHMRLVFLSCCLECVGHRVRLMVLIGQQKAKRKGEKMG